MELCDIIFKRGKEKRGLWNKIKWYFSYAIRFLTADGAPIKESYSHVGIYAGNNRVWDARYPRVDLYSLDYEDYDVFRVYLSAEQKRGILAYCESRKGIRYATDELIKQGLNEIFHIPVKLDFTDEEECSTFVADAFQNVKVTITRKPFPVPNDLAWSPILKQVPIS